jgi:hypothetical protein
MARPAGRRPNPVWVVSGFFFTLFPIERIRSEHLVRPPDIEAPDLTSLGDLQTLRDPQGRSPIKLTIENRSGADVVLAEYATGAPALFNAHTLDRLSPLTGDAAARVAQAHLTINDSPTTVEPISRNGAEYKGPLPAWRVHFARDDLAVYVAADTGVVTARRSNLWRAYDTLWALHIMDWRHHENFNHPLIIITAAITLLSVIAGGGLLFGSRFVPTLTPPVWRQHLPRLAPFMIVVTAHLRPRW